MDNKSDGLDDYRWRIAQQRRQDGAQTTMGQGRWSQGRPKEETEARMTRTWPWGGSEENCSQKAQGGGTISVGHPEFPAEPQPRARGAWESGQLSRAPTPQHGALGEAGCKRGAATWRSEWGLLLSSPRQANFGTNICSAVHRKRANWQARQGQSLAQATHRAEAVIHVLKPFPLLSLVIGPPILSGHLPPK